MSGEESRILFERIPGSQGTAEGAAEVVARQVHTIGHLSNVLAAIRDLHVESTYGGWCAADLKTWPCPTRAALSDSEVTA